MLNNHASIVSSLQNGKVKFRGTPNFQEGFEDRFSKDNEGSWILEISSGTIEMKDNKVIVLAD
jgi:F-type H+-transporting ATPase subunit epsilon